MRLIDADKFIEYLGLNAENSREDNLGEIVTLKDFDKQPTAYDVDKVVEQLENLKDKIYREDGSLRASNRFIKADYVIKIAKNGGCES